VKNGVLVNPSQNSTLGIEKLRFIYSTFRVLLGAKLPLWVCLTLRTLKVKLVFTIGANQILTLWPKNLCQMIVFILALRGEVIPRGRILTSRGEVDL
jgi:hypothetical protein